MVPTVSLTSATTFSPECCQTRDGDTWHSGTQPAPGAGTAWVPAWGQAPQLFPTCLRWAACRSSWITSCPTQPEALKPLVQLSSTACRRGGGRGWAAALPPTALPVLPGLEPPPHLIQAHLLAGEGEGEAKRQDLLHQVLLQLEVHDALDNVVKELWKAATVSGPRLGQGMGVSQPHPRTVGSEGGDTVALSLGHGALASPPRQCLA